MNQYTNNTITREQRESNFIKRLNEKNKNIKYVSGYIHSDKQVLLECKICGYRFNANASCVRASHILMCPNCRKNIFLLLKEQQRSIEAIKKRNNKELQDIFKNIRRNTIHIIKCKYCNGEIYVKRYNKQACDKCARKKYKKNHSCKSLKELYKRDKGICYICGNKCDYEDYIYRGNTFIAGNYYPSIDHVIPLNKGGTDEWDNLKLAHRICNSLKGDKQLD